MQRIYSLLLFESRKQVEMVRQRLPEARETYGSVVYF